MQQTNDAARRAPSLVDQRRHAAREHGLAHKSERDAEVSRVHAGPLPGAFLAGGVEDVVNEMLLSFGSFALEAGDELKASSNDLLFCL